MAEKHGVYIYEEATAITPPVKATAGFPLVFGTAPIHRAANGSGNIGKIAIAYNWSEMVKKIGYDADWAKWTLCEMGYVMFKLYNVAPAGFVNVFDPLKHFMSVLEQPLEVVSGVITIPELDCLMDTVIIDGLDGEIYTVDVDYTMKRNSDGLVEITASNSILAIAVSVKASYNVADPTKITKADIIAATEVVNSSYPLLGLTPGFLLAPGWSDSEVAAVLTAKAQSINNHFNAMAVVDIPTDEENAPNYDDATAWKAANGYTSSFEIVCWPQLTLGGKVYHFSSHYVALAIKTDARYEDIPSVSASNEDLQIDGVCNALGEEIALGPDQAELVNSAGIVTAFRLGQEGWKCWGNRTGCYPGISDPKDAFIPIRRMFNFVGNTLTLTFWQKIDSRMGRPLIDNIVTSCNIILAGWTSRNHLIGGRVLYDPDENPVTDLMNGKIVFHVYLTPPPPAQEIDFILEFDTEYLSKMAQ